ncbi:testis-specific Y-encoded protein 3-like [Meles meles]|uniref:testis-specific Y-encoded protein 3-like n=1 Tax=Meles meles TaxID=9662 RepID=UPI001E6A0097|nr:testis-specific Y-encoded protein 3-like [Meles meles]
MESGAGSGEDGAAPESGSTLVPEGCGEEVGALREPGAGREVGALPALGAGAVAAEPVREAKARQAGGEASLGAEWVVLVEDRMAAPDVGAEADEGGEGLEEREEDEEVKEDAEDEGKHIEVVECPEEAEEGDEEAAAEGQGAEEDKEEGENDDKEESVEEEAKEEDEPLNKEEEKPEADSVEEGAKAEEDFEEQVAEDVEAEAEEDKREESQEEAEAQALREKQEGEEQPGAQPGPPGSPLQALRALQSELEPVNKDASRAYSRLKLRFWQRRRRHLDHRSALIRAIPGFWAKAFVNHPQMSAMISGQDKGILGSMTDLKVEDLESPRDRRKILLFFRKNSYFRNEVVEKEYVLRAAGYEPSHSTPIQWHRNYEREAYRRRHHNSSLNFFNWFSDHSFAGSSRIAEILMDDLWPNPLQYYVRKKAPAEGTERRAGERPRAWELGFTNAETEARRNAPRQWPQVKGASPRDRETAEGQCGAGSAWGSLR